MDLNGRRVLITGASRGLGAALAESFAAAGASVVLVARSAEAITALAARLGGVAFAVDLSEQSQVDGLIARIEAECGPIDVLVNNAAVETNRLVDEMDEADIVRTISLNLTTPERLTRQVLPGMLQRGRGHIVNISSMTGIANIPSTSVYSSTKAGLTHFSGGLLADLKGTKVGVTLVEPGPIDTGMWDSITASVPVQAALKRVEKLRLVPHISPAALAAAVVSAVKSDRKHVRYPKRGLLLYLLENAPRRMMAWCLAGVPARG
jgi:short-subunit dehydrogenase